MKAVITVPAITVPITVPEDPLSKKSGCLTAHFYFIVAPPASYPSVHLFIFLRHPTCVRNSRKYTYSRMIDTTLYFN